MSVDHSPKLESLGTAVPREFFERAPRDVAADLLGTVIASRAGGLLTAGRIVETEAYLGSDDPGSHAATRGMTERNSAMYGSPGTLYVYFAYGCHHMLNLVCEPEGTAGAVLLRALEPVMGIEHMALRRGGRPVRELANGPGKLAQALGVDLTDNRSPLGSGKLSIYCGERPPPGEVAISGRIGLSAGHELQLRYYLRHSTFVSRGRLGPPMRSGSRIGQQGRNLA